MGEAGGESVRRRHLPVMGAQHGQVLNAESLQSQGGEAWQDGQRPFRV